MEAEPLILCDTNIIIEVYKENQNIIEFLEKIGQQNLAVSDVTCAELLFGARNKKELQIIKKDLKKLVVFSINEEISKGAVSLIEKFSLSNNLNLPDALIASTAMHHKVQLYTLNKKDFKYIENVTLIL
jgi:tRNA(fMet)-specific endonuclease VapC